MQMHRDPTYDLTTIPATLDQRRLPLLFLFLSLALGIVVFPFAKFAFGVYPGFIPAMCGGLVVADYVIAALLIRQARLARRRSLIILAMAFASTGTLFIPYMVAFQGVFPWGIENIASQAPSWLWVAIHLTIPIGIIWGVSTVGELRESVRMPTIVVSTMAASLAVGFGIIWLGHVLPPITVNPAWQPVAWFIVGPLLLGVVGVALVVLYGANRFRTRLDMWAGVALFAIAMDIIISIASRDRYNLGWYAARLETVITHGVVLFVLLSESGRLNVLVAGAERRMRSVFDGVADAVIAIDSERRITFFNPAARVLFGYEPEEIAELNISYVIPAYSDRPLVLAGGSTVVEAVGKHKDGSTFPVEIAFGEGVEGDRRRTIVIVRDITVRKRADAAIKAARDQAIESANVKAQFLATMSHEIRTPINAVVGMSELLMQSELPAEAYDYAKTVRDSAESLLSVINDILDFSKIDAGKMEMERRPFSLVAVIENAADICASAARAKGLSLVTHVAPDVPVNVLGDAGRVRQILINLIGNAVKFTTQGNIVVRATADHFVGDRVAVRMSVTDTGLGISRENTGRLFEAFHQVDGTARRRFGGTGLGLSISKRLVELMDGRIGVDSTLGSGSTFWFTLPLEQMDDDVKAERPPTLRGARVLVIDDDDTSRAILEQYLMNWGVISTAIENPVHAMALLKAAQIRSAPYDAVLIDFLMPGVDGFALAARIHGDATIAATPLILVTAHDEPGRGSEAIARGFMSYLRKPLKQSQLFDALAGALDPSRKRPVQPKAVAAPDHEGVRVLVAEDNAVNRKLALVQLQKLGYRAHAVADGLEAVAEAARQRYDVILMDCQMPELDGFDATRAIRRAEAATGLHVPIVAMTANALDGDRDACLAAGMDDYLAKPVQLAELRAILERFTAGAVGAR
jgi:two-component system sensor histidine kinase/response regulator